MYNVIHTHQCAILPVATEQLQRIVRMETLCRRGANMICPVNSPVVSLLGGWLIEQQNVWKSETKSVNKVHITT